jgi:hypothetical protein
VNKFLATFATTAFFLMAGAALADNLTLTLTGAGSVVYDDAARGGIYVGPYQVSVNSEPSSPMICDDYATEISVQSNWSANAYTFGQLSQTKFYGNASFGNAPLGAAQAYEEVFYLSAQMMLQTDSTNYAAIHYAIWQIMDPGDNPANNGPTASVSAWLAQAADPGNWQNVNTSDFLVYTPTVLATSGPGASQEFIQVIDPNNATVPLPPTIILLAAGLLGLVGLRKRPKK